MSGEKLAAVEFGLICAMLPEGTESDHAYCTCPPPVHEEVGPRGFAVNVTIVPTLRLGSFNETPIGSKATPAAPHAAMVICFVTNAEDNPAESVTCSVRPYVPATSAMKCGPGAAVSVSRAELDGGRVSVQV